jgi:hypothetical protein
MIGSYFVLAGLLGTAAATVGVDLSQATSLSSLQCVKNYGYDFAIARVYCSTGNPDSNGPNNINNAWKAGSIYKSLKSLHKDVLTRLLKLSERYGACGWIHISLLQLWKSRKTGSFHFICITLSIYFSFV